MTVSKARKLLGKTGETLSDLEISVLIQQVKIFSDCCVENINNKIKSEGINFLNKVK